MTVLTWMTAKNCFESRCHFLLRFEVNGRSFFITLLGGGGSFRASWLFQGAVDRAKECVFGSRSESEIEEIHQNLKTDQN